MIGSSHCWIRLTAGSVDRSGEGICTHHVAVFSTIQRMPPVIACAMPLRMSLVAPATADFTTLLTTKQAGSTRVLQGMGYLSSGKVV